jgi:hypothetical protein
VDGQRIFGAAVDIAMSCADCFGGDNHAFENGVRVGFEDAAVHECTRVAFVGVTEYIFNVARG